MAVAVATVAVVADSMAVAAGFMVAAAGFMAAAAGFMLAAAGFTAVADFEEAAEAVDFVPQVDFAAAAECARVAVNSAPDRAEFVRLRGHLAAIDLSPSTMLRTARSDATRA